MKKFKNKTFLLLTSIITVFIVVILFIFNLVLYNNEYSDLNRKIGRIGNIRNIFNNQMDREPMFMDMDLYVVTYDGIGNIIRIDNYTFDDVSDEDIIKIVNKNSDKIGKIGNLYFNKYILFFTNNYLIIINNSGVREVLFSNLYRSILIFIVLELFIIYACFMLTKWLVRPVEEAFDKQKQFIYDASHELKTPLSIIIASTEELDDKNKLVDNIKSEVLRMNKLVINLLELSKSDEMEEKLVYNDVNLSKLILNKALSFESLMFDSNITLDTKIDRDINFECDSDRIKELLSILVDNAIKHAYDDSKILVSLEKEKDNIILKVTNRGDEIPKDEREKIFERFYRGDKSRNRDSNRYGLGLAIAKNIVSKHNGIISVDCENGYTTFSVVFKNN